MLEQFFHANATIKHRRNLISELSRGDGAVASDHKEKEKILWEDFKVRLGSSQFNGFTVDPGFFIQRVDNLSVLEEPFTQGEIDNVIKVLPNDKSPRLEGFNNELLKKCWPIIKQEFYDLCNDFFENSVCLSSINSSNITFVPKTDGEELSMTSGPFHCLTLQ